jgi:hypothetical protein
MFGLGKQLKSVYVKGIKITPKCEDQPEFKRDYEITVGKGIVVQIEMRTGVCGRSDSSFIKQPNGKYIGFQANAVADRIIDRELYPLVQKAVDEILLLDHEFIKSKPLEFTDETGTTWKRL